MIPFLFSFFFELLASGSLLRLSIRGLLLLLAETRYDDTDNDYIGFWWTDKHGVFVFETSVRI